MVLLFLLIYNYYLYILILLFFTIIIIILGYKILFNISFINIDKLLKDWQYQKYKKKFAKDEIYSKIMNVSTFDKSNEFTHPSVLYFKNSFNGYKFWMVYTPYSNCRVELENPCIAVSNDGINFIPPKNVINPLLPIIDNSNKEYIEYYQKDADEKIYLNYINRSSFPYALKLENETEIDDYLDALYNTIILKDVAQRRKIADTSMLKNVAKFMFNNINHLGIGNNIQNGFSYDLTSGFPEKVRILLINLPDISLCVRNNKAIRCHFQNLADNIFIIVHSACPPKNYLSFMSSDVYFFIIPRI